MPAGLVLLSPTPLLFKHAYWLPADLLPLDIACLLALCFSICYTCWYGVSLSRACRYGISLSAVPTGMVLHYRSCLLVWYLTISHACWCGASLWDMPSGLVPHYRPCLLAWYLTIGLACWSVLHFNRHFDKLSAEGSGVATSLVLLLQRCHYIRHVCWSSATLRHTCLYSAALSDMHAGFIYSERVCKSVSPSGKTSGMLQIHQTCLQVRCSSHWFPTSMDASLNISNSEWCFSCITGMLQGWCL